MYIIKLWNNYCNDEVGQTVFFLRRWILRRCWSVLFFTSADNSFSFYLCLPPPSATPNTRTLSSSPSPHTPPLWSCHLSAPAQSLLRPTAHLPPASLTAPVANANVRTHPHPRRHTRCCAQPHLSRCTCSQSGVAAHICVQIRSPR